MVKTGIPFMLHDSTGSLLESNFIELYDRMNLRVSCLSRDPNGAALYEVYNMLSRYHNIPVAVFEYGAAGALGNISLTGPGGSLRTQTMAAFLVEVGGIDHTTGNSSLLMGMNIAGVGERARMRISSGLASMQVDLLLHGTRFHHLVVCLASRSHIRIS